MNFLKGVRPALLIRQVLFYLETIVNIIKILSIIIAVVQAASMLASKKQKPL